jgi:pimeloyl-ACP methyl ester carboxylesterase
MCNADTSNQLEINMSGSISRTSVLALPVAVLALAVSSACAAPVVGSADDNTFFTYPFDDTPSGVHGDLKTYRQATVKLGAGAPEVNAWNVIYQSKDSLDNDFWQSGTVIVPKAAWTGTGTRPVISYAVGTHGLAAKCAPARKLADGKDYEIANINAALKLGYAVLVTDYEGALAGDASTYLAGKSQGQAALDIVRAASQIPGAGVSASAPVGIWGFSQGGQTAAWAGELAPTYTPNLNIVGVAAGGVPANFKSTAAALDGNIGFAFFGAAINGLSTQYPGAIPLNLIANDAGNAALAKISTQCVFEALFEFQNKTISAYTKTNEPLSALLAIPSVSETLDAQNVGTRKINAPLYLFHGTADEFIPFQQGVNLRKDYCAKGTNVTFEVYPSEHIVTQFQGAAPSLAFLKDRFDGKPATSNCASTAAIPAANPKPGGGDFVVGLDKWPLKASVGLKTLAQTIVLPDTSTFSADANVTAKTLDGTLSIPDFKQTVKVVGIPFPVGIRVTPAGKVSGSVDVDNEGQLHIKAKAPVNITVTSVLGIPFGECKTLTPVEFPINFDGPVSSLGNGNLNFTGSVAFPQIKGCFISGILTALMSGNGQTYNFNVAPPAPSKL